MGIEGCACPALDPLGSLPCAIRYRFFTFPYGEVGTPSQPFWYLLECCSPSPSSWFYPWVCGPVDVVSAEEDLKPMKQLGREFHGERRDERSRLGGDNM